MGNEQASEDLLRQVEHLSNKVLAAEEQKSHFLSNVLNEINNPLASILGLAKSIAQRAYYQPEAVHRQAQLIYGEAFDLDFQMRNIFAAARIEAGILTPSFSMIDVAQVFEHVIVDWQHKTLAKRQHVFFQRVQTTASVIYSDSTMLHSIFTNLLANAMMYSPVDSQIHISFCQTDRMLTVSCQDEGPGIPDDQREVIFERFRQLSEGVRKPFRGSGLGLSIVREYVDVLGGTLAIQSTAGGGSKFEISLPLQSVGEFNAEQVALGEEELF